ncbi:hypothetical protein [Ruminococcus sp.]|uniref:hypothetical protein n=1 Tax=Ruminococcus sp. TaxID=41978 RepID=UPI0025D00451|nr:hypothetical protein [Ruminococcus sp.]
MFTPLYMGTNHMLGQDSFVPIMVNNFEIRVYNMDGSLPGEFSTLLTMTTDEVGDIAEEQDSITVHYGNGLIKFPTKVDYADVDWTLNCYCQPNVFDGLQQWRKLCYDPETEKMGLPSQYMKLVYFIRYDGQGNPKHVIKCPGTWIKGLSSSGGNQEGGEIVKCRTTLVISKAIYLKPEEFNV